MRLAYRNMERRLDRMFRRRCLRLPPRTTECGKSRGTPYEMPVLKECAVTDCGCRWTFAPKHKHASDSMGGAG